MNDINENEMNWQSRRGAAGPWGRERRGPGPHPRRGGGERGERGERRGMGGPGGRGGRLRRGDMRRLLLAGLLDGPAHGYELMQRLEQRSGGRWRPSPGSVYPMLQLLEDEGLIRGEEREGRKVYDLTDSGRGEADESAFGAVSGDPTIPDAAGDLRDELHRLHLAAKQIVIAGQAEQATQAATLVRDARQAIYRLLAED